MKDTCNTIMAMARYMAGDFMLMADVILPHLLMHTVVTIKVLSTSFDAVLRYPSHLTPYVFSKVMSQSCDDCIKCIIENSRINLFVLFDGAQNNKSGQLLPSRC